MPNIFADLPAASAEEQLTDLFARPGLRIERIVSTGQASPPGFWYDQAHDEWVILLQGSAGLAIDGEAEMTARARRLRLPAGAQAPPRHVDGCGQADRVAGGACGGVRANERLPTPSRDKRKFCYLLIVRGVSGAIWRP